MIIRALLTVLVLVVCCAVPVRAETRLIVRMSNGLPGIQSACRLVGCTVVRGLGDPLSQLFLVILPDLKLSLGLLNSLPLNLLSTLSRLTGVLGIELDTVVNVVENVRSSGVPSGLLDRTPVPLGASTVWRGYANQPAAGIIRLNEAQQRFGSQGAGTVAIIDTGIDPNHPALRNVVVAGYDFTRDQQGMGSETGDINQSTTAVVDGSPMAVNSSTVAVVNQSTTAVVDDPKFAAFGHGTMVAGLVHLVSPRAMISSLKAFRADGTGYMSDVIRAVYWAANSNARVINMSFSTPSNSPELITAFNYAVQRGAICVSSAGNDGRNTVVYPASLDSVMGVASTDMRDQRSRFSNYGDKLVWVGAPGECNISTYPGGTYAAGSGTSFSTPLVSGTAALLVGMQPSVDHWTASKAIGVAKPVGGDLGHGRLDVYMAAEALRYGR
jgi:subtilisin family serine protease